MRPAQSTFSKVLGIRSTDPLTLMSAVEHGLPLATLDRVVQAVAPADNKFAFRIVSRPTLGRRRKALSDAKKTAEGRLSPEDSARLARLASAWPVALETCGSVRKRRSASCSSPICCCVRALHRPGAGKRVRMPGGGGTSWPPAKRLGRVIAQKLDRVLTAYRIGDPHGAYPICPAFSTSGAGKKPAQVRKEAGANL